MISNPYKGSERCNRVPNSRKVEVEEQEEDYDIIHLLEFQIQKVDIELVDVVLSHPIVIFIRLYKLEHIFSFGSIALMINFVFYFFSILILLFRWTTFVAMEKVFLL